MKVVEDFKNWASLEEASCCQNSRELWLKEWDKNIRFFHIMENSHRRRNSLNRTGVGGVWVEGEEEVRGAIINTFMDLVPDQGEWRVSIKGLKFSRLIPSEVDGLEEAFSLSEVLTTLK